MEAWRRWACGTQALANSTPTYWTWVQHTANEVEDDDRPRDPIKVVRARMGTTQDLERAAAAAKEKLLEDAKRGAKGSQFVYGNWD